MKIHEIIKQLRLRHRYSQKELSDKLNMTQAGYNRIERGFSNLNHSRLQQIAEVFCMSATADRYFSKDKPISLSVIKVLIAKGLLIDMKPNMNAYEKRIYKAIIPEVEIKVI